MVEKPIRGITMRCLQCSYPLDGLASRICPECSTEFDPGDPLSFRRIIDNPVRLARLRIGEATAAHIELERQDIPAFIEPEAAGIIGHVDLPQASVWVAGFNLERAKAVLTELVQRKSTETEWVCPNCDEVIEPQFVACWNCGAERSESGADQSPDHD